jgi:hypothetical protein
MKVEDGSRHRLQARVKLIMGTETQGLACCQGIKIEQACQSAQDKNIGRRQKAEGLTK